MTYNERGTCSNGGKAIRNSARKPRQEDHLKTIDTETRPFTSTQGPLGRLVCKKRWEKMGKWIGNEVKGKTIEKRKSAFYK